ncbi:MAG: glycosyltransferase [Saprospiraceae bacterium]|nr:glycosyltransferase [Saprospiraceae bacterium]
MIQAKRNVAPLPLGGGVGGGVDVLMLAYNVAPYIAQAIEGVLAQETDFPVRLVIGEDCSTDETPSICQAYANKYPERILFLPGDQNLGIAGNANRALSHCTARYLAICDGDDIWTDPAKLQKQVSFLENNPDYGLSYSDVHIISETSAAVQGDEHDELRSCYAGGDIFLYLLGGNFINNSTAVVRHDLLRDHVIDTDRKYYIHDYLMWLHVALRSRVHFLPETTTAYRKHSGGVTNSEEKARYNGQKLQEALFGILHDFDRLYKQPLAREDKKRLFRKMLSLLYRNAGTWRQKLGLLPLLFKYFPGLLSYLKKPQPSST